MGDHTREILTFLDGLQSRKRHPFAEFLESLRSSPNNCIFGAGELAANVCHKLTRPAVGIKIHCCCDNDTRKWGKTFFGVPCLSLPELLAMKDEVTVLIVTGYCHEIYPQLKQAGIPKLYVLNKEHLILYADALMRRLCDESEFGRLRDQIVTLMDLLADEESRRTAATVIRNWFTFSPFEQDYLNINVPDQYFPADIFQLSDREVFVDLGAYDGKNTFDFIERSGKHFLAAYAFEMDQRNFGRMTDAFEKDVDGSAYSVREVLSPADMGSAIAASRASERAGGAVFLCNFGVGSKNEKIRYCSLFQGSAIDADGECTAEIARIDDILAGQAITLLKMDIEGAEMNALEGASATIRRWKPKIAACVYHNPDHMLQIPPFLKNLVPDYRLFFRHHTNTDLETVCYAIC